jgi:hypothetical protein
MRAAPAQRTRAIVEHDDADRRAAEREDRRRGDRRRSQLAVFIERRFAERRRVPRRLIDAFRSFLGLAPLDE